MPILFLLFVAVPIIEIAVLLRVGSSIGWLSTLLIVIGTAALGTWMLRQQGARTLQSARSRLDAGQLPADELLEGVVLLFGGTMLLTPGFVTDAAGFLCLLPVSRRWLAQRIGRQAMTRAGVTTFGAGRAGPVPPDAKGRADAFDGAANEVRKPAGPGARGKGGDVIDGEYERID